MLSIIRTELPPLAGIVHAAGEFASAALFDMDEPTRSVFSRERSGVVGI